MHIGTRSCMHMHSRAMQGRGMFCGNFYTLLLRLQPHGDAPRSRVKTSRTNESKKKVFSAFADCDANDRAMMTDTGDFHAAGFLACRDIEML